ncbi:MAG: cytochrome b6-f complex iron-sulfur subunit [Candidatus Sumerlaeota bacterium]|nr:cytochrome b6-f complex iron-sulfur subunit [Candidatus Sumerlaeota bacterium]
MPDSVFDDGLTPAEENDDGLVSRRSFIKVVGGCVGAAYAGAIGYPVYRYLATPVTRAAAATAVTEVELDATELEPGSVLMFRFGTSPGILIHHKDGSWVAFSAVCTHLGCTVQYELDNDRIFCACHGGVYDPHTGDAVSGPPPKGLTVFRVEVGDAKVIVSRS